MTPLIEVKNLKTYFKMCIRDRNCTNRTIINKVDCAKRKNSVKKQA